MASRGEYDDDDDHPVAAAMGDETTGSVDERTILTTPAPLAASTVHRSSPRYRDASARGSFINELPPIASRSQSSLTSSQQSEQGAIPFIDRSSQEEERGATQPATIESNRSVEQSDDFGGDAHMMNRSSLGILPIEDMANFSTNLLSFGDSACGGGKSFNMRRDSEEPTPKATNQEPHESQSEDEEGMFAKKPSTPPFVPMTGGGYDDGSVDICGGRETPPPPPSRKLPPQPPMPMPFFSTLQNMEQDPDTSVHEIEINANELAEFDEEFSDLDDTMQTTDSGEHPDGASHSRPPQQENLFASPHPLREEDLQIEEDPDAESFDYCDMQRRDPDQGEGQEEEEEGSPVVSSARPSAGGSSSGAVLDSRFFRQSPMTTGNEELSPDSSALPHRSRIFDQTDGDEDDGTEGSSLRTDSEDDVEAVRREMVATYLRLNEGVRQSAEGESSFQSPGDGGDGSSGHDSDDQQGLPSSATVAGGAGRGRGRRYLRANEPPVGHDTDDDEDEDDDEYLEAGGEVRMRPQGDELMAERRHVRFAPADNINAQDTPQDDDDDEEEEEDELTEGQTEEPEEEEEGDSGTEDCIEEARATEEAEGQAGNGDISSGGLAHYLAPSVASKPSIGGASFAGDGSAWMGLENSTFNMNDLYKQGSNKIFDRPGDNSQNASSIFGPSTPAASAAHHPSPHRFGPPISFQHSIGFNVSEQGFGQQHPSPQGFGAPQSFNASDSMFGGGQIQPSPQGFGTSAQGHNTQQGYPASPQDFGATNNSSNNPFGPNNNSSNPLGPNNNSSNPFGPNNNSSNNPFGPNNNTSNPFGPSENNSNPFDDTFDVSSLGMGGSPVGRGQTQPGDSLRDQGNQGKSFMGMGDSLRDPQESFQAPREEQAQPGPQQTSSQDNKTYVKQDQSETADHNESTSSKKHFLADNSPVYVNEEGEVVTDLAYQVPLEQMFDNPLNGGGGDDQLQISSDEFRAGSDALAMLADDEEKFQKENVISEGDMMQTTGSTLGLPDSWSFHSEAVMSRPSWLSAGSADTATAEAYMRISIGEFMLARTEALGALDGDEMGASVQRPNFGSNFATPPDNRRPVALIDHHVSPPASSAASSWSPPRLQGIQSASAAAYRGAGEGHADQPQDGLPQGPRPAPQLPHPPPPRESPPPRDDSLGGEQDEVRNLAVGEDEDDEEDGVARFSPASFEDLRRECLSVLSSSPDSRPCTPGLNNETAELDMSQIRQFITGASASASSTELVNVILKMAKSKKSTSTSSGKSSSVSSAGSRKPADGVSEGREAAAAAAGARSMSGGSLSSSRGARASGGLQRDMPGLSSMLQPGGSLASSRGATRASASFNSGLQRDMPGSSSSSSGASSASRDKPVDDVTSSSSVNRNNSNTAIKHDQDALPKHVDKLKAQMEQADRLLKGIPPPVKLQESQRSSKEAQSLNRSSKEGHGQSQRSSKEGQAQSQRSSKEGQGPNQRSSKESQGQSQRSSKESQGSNQSSSKEPKYKYSDSQRSSMTRKSDGQRSTSGDSQRSQLGQTARKSTLDNQRSSNAEGQQQQQQRLSQQRSSTESQGQRASNQGHSTRSLLTKVTDADDSKRVSGGEGQPKRSSSEEFQDTPKRPKADCSKPKSAGSPKRRTSQSNAQKEKENLAADVRPKQQGNKNNNKSLNASNVSNRSITSRTSGKMSSTAPAFDSKSRKKSNTTLTDNKAVIFKDSILKDKNVLLELDRSSTSNSLDTSLKAINTDSDSDKWKSPRPSSVFTRSRIHAPEIPFATETTPVKASETEKKSISAQNNLSKEAATKHDTPEELVATTPGRRRMSSTPNELIDGDDTQHLTMGVTLSPMYSTTMGGGDQTVDGDVFKNQPLYYQHQQEAKQPPYSFPHTVTSSPTRNTNSLQQPQIPTLLTSQSLQDTAFASQYLGTSQSQSRKGITTTAASMTTSVGRFDDDSIISPSMMMAGSQAQGMGTRTVTTSGTAEHSSSITSPLAAPSVLRFPVCCAGLSSVAHLPLTNTCGRWLHVSIRLSRLTLDGQPHSPQAPCFIVKDVMLQPNSSEEIKVIFCARQSGVYVGGLQLISAPVVSDQPLVPSPLPLMITLQAVAETPHVQVYGKQANGAADESVADFGYVPWGCCKSSSISLLNYTNTNVPVRITISARKSAWGCFSFQQPVSHGSSITTSPAPGSSGGRRSPLTTTTVINHTLPTCTAEDVPQPVQIPVYFKAPSRLSLSSGPEELCGSVEVEVDTPASNIILASIPLRVVVGTARLHCPSTLDVVVMKTQVGGSISRVIPLRNAGTIPLEISLDVLQHADHFTVTPMQLMIEAGGQSQVVLKFNPKPHASTKTESSLSMFVEPDGPGYEIDILGHVSLVPKQVSAASGSSTSSTLLSNLHHLVWSGVPLGRAIQQTVILKNIDDQATRLRMEILKSNTGIPGHTDFHFQSVFGGTGGSSGDSSRRPASSKEIIVNPGEEFPVNILFAPSKKSAREAMLRIRQTEKSAKYMIPLSGYGGRSQLHITEVDRRTVNEDKQASIDMGPVMAGHSKQHNLVLRNTGDRHAYWTAVCYQDTSCTKKLPWSVLSTSPGKGVLSGGGHDCTVHISLEPTDVQAALCYASPATVGTVVIFWGDETMRSKFRRRVQSGKSSRPSKEHPAEGLDFNVFFEGEQSLDDSSNGENDDAGILQQRATPHDVDVFFSSMNKMVVSLVGHPPPPPPPPVSIPSIPSVSSLQSQSQQSLTVEKDLANTNANKFPFAIRFNEPERAGGLLGRVTPPVKDMPPPSITAQLWAIVPSQIILQVPRDKSSAGDLRHFQLINYSDKRSLSYELMWPGHRVVVAPDHGVVAPRSTVAICVSAAVGKGISGISGGGTDAATATMGSTTRGRMLSSSSSSLSTTSLPWSGAVLVTCEGQQKSVSVQLHEDYAPAEESVLLTDSVLGMEPLLCQPGTPLLSVMLTPSPAATPSSPKKQQQLRFTDTPVAGNREMEVELSNISPFPVKWTMASFAPPYLKKCSSSGSLGSSSSAVGSSVYRVTYASFWLPTLTGLLHPQQTQKVVCCFCPRDPGVYSQFWEIKSETQASVHHAKHTSKMEFIAQAYATNASSTTAMASSSTERLRGSASQTSSSRRSRSPSQPSKEAISLQPADGRLEFPVTQPHTTSLVKYKLKNCTDRDQQVMIHCHALPPPFYTKHSTVSMRPYHYVRVPVQFKPDRVGHFEASIIIEADSGLRLPLHLVAECKH